MFYRYYAATNYSEFFEFISAFIVEKITIFAFIANSKQK